jgi:hypothetical protein
MLVPFIGLVQRVTIAHADRYTYLSQIGLSLALAWGVWTVCQSRHSHEAVSTLSPGGTSLPATTPEPASRVGCLVVEHGEQAPLPLRLRRRRV